MNQSSGFTAVPKDMQRMMALSGWQNANRLNRAQADACANKSRSVQGLPSIVSIMLDVLARCFPDQINSPAWEAKLKNIIPTYGQSLSADAELCANTRKRTSELLGLL